MAGEQTQRRSRLGQFRRPRWRDPAFWAAVAITAAVFAIQVLIAGQTTSWLSWIGLGVRLVVTWLVISALIRIRVGMERGIVAGFADAEREADAPGAPSPVESAARAGGRLAGRALRAYRRGTEPDR
jgi:hypothetical protein